jgi:hypothetical protein
MFTYSLPILFGYMQFGTPVEFIGVICFLLIVLYIATHVDSGFKEREWGAVTDLSLYKYLFDSWDGMVKLWLVFWPFFIILNLSLFGTDSMAKAGIITVSTWDEIHFILLTPVIFWTIIVWRNSFNSCSRYWAAAARFMTLAVFFEYALKLAIRKDYPRIFFECQEAALDYAACF